MDAKYTATLWTDTGFIELNRSVRMGRELVRLHNPGIDRNQIIEKWINAKIDIVVVVTNARAGLDCIRYIQANTTRDIVWQLTVVDNDCDEFTSKLLVDHLDHNRDRLIRINQFGGFLPAFHVACENTDGDWIIHVDQHVLVSPGWLESMLAAVKERVGIVTPLSNNVLPMLPGHNMETMCKVVKRFSSRLNTEIAFPRNFCAAFSRTVYQQVGGFDVGYYTPGYGEFYEFYLKMLQYDKVAVVADDCFVLDESQEVYRNLSWQPENRAGYLRFMERWRDDAFEIYGQHRNWEYVEDIVQKININERKNLLSNRKTDTIRPRVIFVFREFPLCGAVLAAIHICNELIELGYDATIACTRIENSHRKYLPMRFEPYVCGSETEMERMIRENEKDAVIIATIWFTCENVKRICHDRPDFTPMYFVQDDERKFKHNSGEYYAEAQKIEETYTQFDNMVVNSHWVQDMLEEEFKRKTTYLGIGVDPYTFYPREKPDGRIRVMAHCRHTTPRRGWPFIAKVLNRVALSRPIEVVTYDEEPPDLQVTWHGHIGQVSPTELARHMGLADIFIEGSEIQGWGMQALEAMASGCALVSTPNKGINNYGTNGHDCIIVPHGDVETAAGVICHLVDKKEDRQLIAQNGRQTAMAFDWSVVARKWSNYLACIRKREQ